jgi:aspartyl/asparaginyl beta-hydroxylase (cupin superfamily)
MGFSKQNVDYEFNLPADGSVYFFNSGIKHWVHNNSDQARIHLIIDTHGQEDLTDFTELSV